MHVTSICKVLREKKNSCKLATTSTTSKYWIDIVYLFLGTFWHLLSCCMFFFELWYVYCSIRCSKELMYQQALCRFGNFNAIQLSEPAPLRELLLMALKDDELMGDENDEEKLEIAEVSCFLTGSILC